MKVTFSIDYRTKWGESLFLAGATDALGAGDDTKAVAMKPEGTSRWTVTVDIPQNSPDFSYRYFVRHEKGNMVAQEWGKEPHTFRHQSGYTPTIRIN
ncbi:MAG: hypothetical protein K2L69_05335, partial [Muribaculaceae bacterium]|nr:hypothetical protein [Muribaculaceae bacterium]